MAHRQRALVGIGADVPMDLFDNFNDGSIDTSLWTVTNPDSKLTESGGNLIMASSGAGSFHDHNIVSVDTFSLEDGRMMCWGEVSATNRHDFRFAPTDAPSSSNMRYESPNRLRGRDGEYFDTPSSIADGTDAFALAYGVDNQHLFWRDAGDGVWRRLIVNETIPGGDVYAIFSRTFINTEWSLDYVAIPTPASGQLAPTDSASNPSASATLDTASGNFNLRIEITTLPSSGEISILFRQQDGTHYWELTLDATTATLWEADGGAPVSRGSGAVIDGDVLLLQVTEGSRISVMKEQAAALINYTSATTFKNETGVTFDNLGTGGVLAVVRTYEYVVSGALKTRLEAIHSQGVR